MVFDNLDIVIPAGGKVDIIVDIPADTTQYDNLKIEPNADGHLVISNIGSSGQDGVSIDLEDNLGSSGMDGAKTPTVEDIIQAQQEEAEQNFEVILPKTPEGTFRLDFIPAPSVQRDSSGNLVISNIGSSGQDGVSIDLDNSDLGNNLINTNPTGRDFLFEPPGGVFGNPPGQDPFSPAGNITRDGEGIVFLPSTPNGSGFDLPIIGMTPNGGVVDPHGNVFVPGGDGFFQFHPNPSQVIPNTRLEPEDPGTDPNPKFDIYVPPSGEGMYFGTNLRGNLRLDPEDSANDGDESKNAEDGDQATPITLPPSYGLGSKLDVGIDYGLADQLNGGIFNDFPIDPLTLGPQLFLPNGFTPPNGIPAQPPVGFDPIMDLGMGLNGGGTFDINPGGQLVISNIGSSGQDGVRQVLPPASPGTFQFDGEGNLIQPPNLVLGDYDGDGVEDPNVFRPGPPPGAGPDGWYTFDPNGGILRPDPLSQDLIVSNIGSSGDDGVRQDLPPKGGETMLPEEGDYGLGFDADPFLNYVENFLNDAAKAPNTGTGVEPIEGNTLSAEFFTPANRVFAAGAESLDLFPDIDLSLPGGEAPTTQVQDPPAETQTPPTRRVIIIIIIRKQNVAPPTFVGGFDPTTIPDPEDILGDSGNDVLGGGDAGIDILGGNTGTFTFGDTSLGNDGLRSGPDDILSGGPNDGLPGDPIFTDGFESGDTSAWNPGGDPIVDPPQDDSPPPSCYPGQYANDAGCGGGNCPNYSKCTSQQRLSNGIECWGCTETCSVGQIADSNCRGDCASNEACVPINRDNTCFECIRKPEDLPPACPSGSFLGTSSCSSCDAGCESVPNDDNLNCNKCKEVEDEPVRCESHQFQSDSNCGGACNSNQTCELGVSFTVTCYECKDKPQDDPPPQCPQGTSEQSQCSSTCDGTCEFTVDSGGLQCYTCSPSSPPPPSCPSGHVTDSNCLGQCDSNGACVQQASLQDGTACYSCVNCPSGTFSSQSACQAGGGTCTVVGSQGELQCWKKQASCEDVCTQAGYSATAIDFTAQVESQLNSVTCVSSYSMNLQQITTGECTCHPVEAPVVTFDTTPPVCKGTACGDITCGNSASCPGSEPNTTITVTCNWGGWQKQSQYQYAPKLGN